MRRGCGAGTAQSILQVQDDGGHRGPGHFQGRQACAVCAFAQSSRHVGKHVVVNALIPITFLSPLVCMPQALGFFSYFHMRLGNLHGEVAP